MVTDEVLQLPYLRSGTEEDPYIFDWILNDPRNPMLFPAWKKWIIAVTVAFGTLAVSFASTAFSGYVKQIEQYFHTSTELATLSISLFVLGFAIGPMTWAPLSELYGRQVLWFTTFALMTVCGACFDRKSEHPDIGNPEVFHRCNWCLLHSQFCRCGL